MRRCARAGSGAILLALMLCGCASTPPQGAPSAEITVEDLPEDAGVASASNAPPARAEISKSVPATLPQPLEFVDRPSPNYDVRTRAVNMIVLHYTAEPSLRKALTALCSTRGPNRVSAHYVVARDGTVYRLVDESRRAWHAGHAYWNGIVDVNSASVGIEIDCAGVDRRGRPVAYTRKQIESVIRLCQDIMRRHQIRHVVGHSDVAPARKVDPGEQFPWKRLAAAGVGTWTDAFLPTETPISTLLAQLGYDTRNLYMAVQAFRRHYFPEGLKGRPLEETAARANAVLQRLRRATSDPTA